MSKEVGGFVMPAKIVDCPICGTPMQKRVVGDGVEIDFCDWHGMWLDAGELERLLAASVGAQPPRKPGVGKAIAQGLAGAAVIGAGLNIGQRLVGGILDALFNRRV